jgi:hypothetical protein
MSCSYGWTAQLALADVIQTLGTNAGAGQERFAGQLFCLGAHALADLADVGAGPPGSGRVGAARQDPAEWARARQDPAAEASVRQHVGGSGPGRFEGSTRPPGQPRRRRRRPHLHCRPACPAVPSLR